MRSRFIALVLIMAGIAAFGSEIFAQKKGKELKAAEERVDKASAVVRDVMRINEKAIPRDLLAKAKAIVVFPGALKFGFILGGQGGEGVVIRRLANGWSAPAFMNMAGGSIGAQIGGQKTDYVLLIMNEKGLKGLLEDKFEIGGEGSVSAGPVGRTAAASTNVTLDAEILSYSRSRGLFAGVALKGVVIKQDESINQAIYQKSAKEILGGTGMEWSSAPVSLQEFSKLVATYAK
ncbi:MAG TPA: lipid-binding SYLF domain-containing protein [Pyrinomonadaceae bacterium]|jgi:lipid-binding SYLF domain-containing protein|nr:lipid-binding SYLF domain-containing protein [Chloracidobacterium sp.]MBP9935777.1 lipid-binding SYLF domain-containing protein [Pyrinomonadaceae bacterium]MBK7801272.1 lipid-binding SYLF domain-containing protein [Chloracidobacterium sp.]MBK9436591.1 lipid-binding SYLF domain-containing protein [Chloracidobacterium sp.]MBK9767488.1 lipid-binding SYLF domain-containing protein [Chloracidobacterium sp.]